MNNESNLKNSLNALIVFVLTSISLTCFSQSNISDSTYSKMFWLASGKIIRNDTTYQIFSTSPFYVVITVTDIKTGQTKEICTEYPYIDGAIRKDSGNAYVDTRNRIFKFKSNEALNNIGFFDFDDTTNTACTKGITVEKLQKEWNEDYIIFWNTYSGNCQKYYAYLLFKNGIMTTRGSLAGEFSILSDEEIKEYENKIKKQ